MSINRITHLLFCLAIGSMSITSIADELSDSAAMNNALQAVIRECNNLASKGDLKIAEALSKKEWTERQKAELMAVSHNGSLQICLMGMALELKKYADRIDVKSSE